MMSRRSGGTVLILLAGAFFLQQGLLIRSDLLSGVLMVVGLGLCGVGVMRLGDPLAHEDEVISHNEHLVHHTTESQNDAH